MSYGNCLISCWIAVFLCQKSLERLNLIIVVGLIERSSKVEQRNYRASLHYSHWGYVSIHWYVCKPSLQFTHLCSATLHDSISLPLPVLENPRYRDHQHLQSKFPPLTSSCCCLQVGGPLSLALGQCRHPWNHRSRLGLITSAIVLLSLPPDSLRPTLAFLVLLMSLVFVN